MIALNYEALQGSEITTEPFPFLVVRHFVPPDMLRDVIDGLPALTEGGSFPIDALSLTGAAKELAGELEGARLRGVIESRFDLDLSTAPTMITLRGQSREKDGRIHRDSAAKRVTVLLYLNVAPDSWSRHDGCLRLLRGPDQIEDYAVEVPPVDGTLLVFPNGPSTWHGHRQFVGPRYVIQLNYMSDSRAARFELGRHRLSAIVKRLKAA